MSERTRQGRFVDEALPSLCEWVAHPDVPSPAGGTVTAACAALVASLTALITRVTRNRMEKRGDEASVAALDRKLEEALALRQRLLEYGEQDVYEAQKIIQGQRAACVRHDVGSPAKIAGTIVKVLRLTEEVAGAVPRHLFSDLRVVAYVAHGAVYGITEIALANLASAGGADEKLQERIQRWRREADEIQGRILQRT